MNKKAKYHKRGMMLILNKDNPVIEDPTVLLEWKLSQALCLLNPEHVLMVIQNQSEVGDDFRGERHIIKTALLEHHMQFHRNGLHQVTLFLLAGTVNLKTFSKDILKRSSHRTYENPVDIEKAIQMNDDVASGNTEIFGGLINKQVLLVQSFKLEIPDGLFADKPKWWLMKFLWDIVNTGRKYGPVDQCEMRKRAFVSVLTLHFCFVLLWRVGVLSLWSMALTFALVVGRVLILLAGYRPQPLFEGVGFVWSRQIGDGDFLGTSFFSNKYGVDKLKLQEFDQDDWRVWSNPGSDKRMFITPIGVLLMVVSAWYLISNGREAHMLTSFIMVFWMSANLALVYLRLSKPISDDANLRFWGMESDQSEAAKMKYVIWMALAGIVACLVWLPYRVGVDEVLSVFLMILLVLAALAVATGLVLLVVRIAKKQWEKQEAIWKQREEEEQLKWDEFYRNWRSRYAGGGEHFVLATAPPTCDICEQRTFFDRIRLLVGRAKTRVCKPYSV